MRFCGRCAFIAALREVLALPPLFRADVLGAPTLTTVFTNVLQSYRPPSFFGSRLHFMLKMNGVEHWLGLNRCGNLREALHNVQCLFQVTALFKFRRSVR